MTPRTYITNYLKTKSTPVSPDELISHIAHTSIWSAIEVGEVLHRMLAEGKVEVDGDLLMFLPKQKTVEGDFETLKSLYIYGDHTPVCVVKRFTTSERSSWEHVCDCGWYDLRFATKKKLDAMSETQGPATNEVQQELSKLRAFRDRIINLVLEEKDNA